MEHLGMSDFHRLRIGIGRPSEGQTAEDYVLETFSRDEKEKLPQILERVGKVALAWLEEGPKKARDLLSRR
jgi:PTH1 family peptidyl-tRNA hydrolase